MVLELKDSTTYVLCTTTLLLLTYFLYSKFNKFTSLYPDGPPTLPILGNLHQLLMTKDMNLIHFLEENRRKYGNIYTVEFGGVKRVVVSGYDNFQELFVKNADYTSYHSRESFPTAFTEMDTGIIFAEYPHWKTLRSFSMTMLRSEGMGKSSLEPQIMHEIHCYMDHFITPNLNQPISMSRSMTLATANIIGAMIHGGRSEYEDPNFHRWTKSIVEAIAANVKAAVAKNIPFAAYLPGDLAAIAANKQNFEIFNNVGDAIVAERKAMLDPTRSVTYIDRFLLHAAKEDEKGNTNHVFTDGNASASMNQLYAGGMETTSTAMRWALLFMCTYPEIQSKVQREIDETIGSREVSTDDRLALVYTEAVILETLRLANVIPTAIPHTLEKDMTIDGTKIPAGAEMMLNMASILWDENVFEDPKSFKPERYLTGDTAAKKARTIPFGIGRRICLGQSLARMELSLFFTTLMQRFKVKLPEGQKPCLKGVCSAVNAPAEYQIIFDLR